MKLLWYDEIDSTNTEAKRLAEAGANHGTIIGTEHQTQGRGRRGNTWSCNRGEGILCSIIYKAPKKTLLWNHISLLTGLSIIQNFATHGIHAQLKWPNDILVDDKKIAGILIEANPKYAIIGIGINLTSNTFKSLPSMPPFTSMSETGKPIECSKKQYTKELRDSLLKSLEHKTEFDLASQINPHLAWLGSEVTLSSNETPYSGTLVGIDNEGCLLLKGNDHRVLKFYNANTLRKQSLLE